MSWFAFICMLLILIIYCFQLFPSLQFFYIFTFAVSLVLLITFAVSLVLLFAFAVSLVLLSTFVVSLVLLFTFAVSLVLLFTFPVSLVLAITALSLQFVYLICCLFSSSIYCTTLSLLFF